MGPMKRLSSISMLSCAFASALLIERGIRANIHCRRCSGRQGKKLVAATSDAAVDDDTLSLYPTAEKCGECHNQIYEEWSSSQHAYSSISPMFHKFEQKFQELTQGTVGTFCVRCHQQVGTQLGEARQTPLWASSPISREGVTCITCHRVKRAVRQGQRRAPGRAGKDLRAGLRQRRKERDQGRPRRQGNLLG